MEKYQFKAKVLVLEYFWTGEIEKSHASFAAVLEGDHKKAIESRIFGDCAEVEILHTKGDGGQEYNVHIQYHEYRNAEDCVPNYWHKPTIQITPEGNTLIMQFGEYKGDEYWRRS